MRVAHIIKAKQIGGAERHLLILLPALRERGTDAHLILMVEPDNLMTDMVHEAESLGIPVQRVVLRGNLDPLFIWRLRGVLRRLKPDIVHTHLIHADFLGLMAAKLTGVKTVITGRHNDDDFRNRPLLRHLHRIQWRMVQGGIAISDAIEAFVVETEHAPSEKVRVVTYGVPHESPTPQQIDSARAALRQKWNLPPDAPVVGMACRLVEQKGVVYGLRAFAQIAPEFPESHLIIAGEGPLRDFLGAESEKLNLDGRVHFVGWLDDVPAMLAGLDIFLSPSLWEGFGLVLLEAMSCRVPIVASRVSAIPEVIQHEETGLLVPPRDVSALADALRILLHDPVLRKHMGLVGEDRLESQFSARAMADRTIRVYESFLSG